MRRELRIGALDIWLGLSDFVVWLILSLACIVWLGYRVGGPVICVVIFVLYTEGLVGYWK